MLDGIRPMTGRARVYYAFRDNAAWVSASAAIVAAMLGLGPCASKEYVVQASREARAATISEMQRHEMSDRELRDALRSDIAEVRKDVRRLLDILEERHAHKQ